MDEIAQFLWYALPGMRLCDRVVARSYLAIHLREHSSEIRIGIVCAAFLLKIEDLSATPLKMSSGYILIGGIQNVN
jgi:hypothetical protein